MYWKEYGRKHLILRYSAYIGWQAHSERRTHLLIWASQVDFSNSCYLVRFELFTGVTMKIAVF
jgi:hypothetical protein